MDPRCASYGTGARTRGWRRRWRSDQQKYVLQLPERQPASTTFGMSFSGSLAHVESAMPAGSSEPAKNRSIDGAQAGDGTEHAAEEIEVIAVRRDATVVQAKPTDALEGHARADGESDPHGPGDEQGVDVGRDHRR
jgi:hypothetical protein